MRRTHVMHSQLREKKWVYRVKNQPSDPVQAEVSCDKQEEIFCGAEKLENWVDSGTELENVIEVPKDVVNKANEEQIPEKETDSEERVKETPAPQSVEVMTTNHIGDAEYEEQVDETPARQNIEGKASSSIEASHPESNASFTPSNRELQVIPKNNFVPYQKLHLDVSCIGGRSFLGLLYAVAIMTQDGFFSKAEMIQEVMDIKRLNNMMSDHGIYSRARLLIAVSNPDLLIGSTCYIELDAYANREVAVLYLEGGPDQMVNCPNRVSSDRGKRRIIDLLKRSMQVDGGTAQYYLSVSDGDPRAALMEFSEDLRWERQ
ncbi:hypothetical protein Vadar_033220 [Vaccinium darrowii]|uniref:Uncharacterized protein n=1 Tax=Vaccinium darrowii TaxID=229202 RepID=A0ACB7Y3K9_9ERIC|nr:hypothetical protein Vadar_033220 [Vaccinium darrowii]